MHFDVERLDRHAHFGRITVIGTLIEFGINVQLLRLALACREGRPGIVAAQSMNENV